MTDERATPPENRTQFPAVAREQAISHNAPQANSIKDTKPCSPHVSTQWVLGFFFFFPPVFFVCSQRTSVCALKDQSK